jgi:hypothetical protein
MAHDGENNTAFDRDFGYLLPFFQKVEAAAASLTAPGAAEELRGLLEGETGRWLRIRELLRGAEGAPLPAPPKAATPGALPAGLTVGSLRERG